MGGSEEAEAAGTGGLDEMGVIDTGDSRELLWGGTWGRREVCGAEAE